jgi:hypothetical protein
MWASGGVLSSDLLAKARADMAQAAVFWREVDAMAHATVFDTPLSLRYEPQRHSPASPLTAIFQADMSARREASMREHAQGVRRAAADLLSSRMAYHHLRKQESLARAARMQAKREQAEGRLQLPYKRSHTAAHVAETVPSICHSNNRAALAKQPTMPSA